jgi:N-formylglutamate amidohydrolase
MTSATRTFELLPGTAVTPLVVSVPHAGTVVPDEDAPLLALEGAGLLRDADLFVDRLCAGVPALGVPVIRALVSRYVVDVNRAPDDVDREACPELANDRKVTPRGMSARGLVWRLTTDGAPVLKRPLTRAELESRIARIHRPYHEQLAALLEERRARFGFAVLLDCHSMPSTGRPGHSDPGARRADIVPGDVRGTSCAPAVSKLVVDHFERAGFAVRPNDPYMGGFITRSHGRPAKGVHAIQLEINRDLYMDEDALRYDETKAARVIPSLLGVVEKLRAINLGRD